jgi:signal peptidase I
MALAVFLIINSIGQAYKIPSGSMENTLLIGDFVVANKVIYGSKIPLIDYRLPAIRDPHPGDIVIFRYPGDGKTPYVKRCVAVEGQKVEISDKILYVDNQKYQDTEGTKYLDSALYPRSATGGNSRDNWGPYIVPRDHFFMMGDNRDNSADSRFWGPVHRDLIIGKPLIIHWSWSEDESAPQVDPRDPLSIPTLFVYNIANFYDRVRWERLLKVVN